MEEVLIPIVVVGILFLALPWMILHYVSKWKTRTSITAEDEAMLDDLYELARRLDDRMLTLERILQDENPSWNPLGGDRTAMRIGQSSDGLETELRSRSNRASDLTREGRS